MNEKLLKFIEENEISLQELFSALEDGINANVENSNLDEIQIEDLENAMKTVSLTISVLTN